MSAATIVFMIATYWVGGSAPTEGGKYLANGQVYDNKQFVAAHRTLPFGTLLHVCLRRSAVERPGLSTLNEGATVDYEIVSDRGKESAGNLKVRK